MVSLLDSFASAPPLERLPRLRREIALAPARSAAGRRYLNLLPVDIAVDANRDGTIKFAGNPSAAGAQDKTEESKPFRFWVNSDQDDTTEKETIPATTPDYADDEIQTIRDLEDFTRLNLYIGGHGCPVISPTASTGY